MKTKEELLSLAKDTLKFCGGDKQKAVSHLSDLCERDYGIMIGMAKYGKEIIDSMVESQQNTKH